MLTAAPPPWTGLELLDPWWLSLALLVPLALWLRRRRGAPAVSFAPAAFTAGLPRSWRLRLLPVPRAAQALGLVLLAVALARPIERVELPREIPGIDILLCLDVSSSMAATDLDPNRTRLELSKAAAAQFVAGRPHDRIGLVRFARYPDLRCPPTLDHTTLLDLLGGLDLVESDGDEDLTGIGTAVARAAQVLRHSRVASQVVVLLTDGEENVATADTPDEIGPARAARLCEQLGVRVYSIAAGIGKQTDGGAWVPLDTTQIRELAEVTGGRFFAARDADAVGAVYAAISALEKAEFDEPRFELRERFLSFLLLGLALVVAGRLLHATVLEVAP